MATNKQWIYARKPNAQVGPGNFDLREAAMPQPKDGEVLVRTTLLSLDPASRAWMQGQTYRSQLNPGDVMAGWGLGEVVESKAPGFVPGDLVSADYGWQQYAALPGRALTKHDKAHKPEHILGVLGITGLTAYFGLLDVGRPRPGETVLVSGAAGAVGSIAGQIAKLMGCRVVGTTRADKCQWLVDELGFDAAVDYTAGNLVGAIKAACPRGVDVYFDNTGGEVLGAALNRMNVWGRVACCGAVANYDTATPSGGPAGVPGFLVTKRIRMEGFVVMDFYARRREAETALATWVEQGKIKAPVDVVEGFDKMPEALAGMFAGKNRGKLMVRV
ncbi:MAG: NADP-dependent oxidoreductase [Alphaproteobacteria bacterium]|nr:NADP-dependent oxidoreductase [Alphaproteobacteria bacterium]MBL7098351.1 NADP-dependent oxidoreductase [Alphaproteobacteria bacterium]